MHTSRASGPKLPQGRNEEVYRARSQTGTGHYEARSTHGILRPAPGSVMWHLDPCAMGRPCVPRGVLGRITSNTRPIRHVFSPELRLETVLSSGCAKRGIVLWSGHAIWECWRFLLPPFLVSKDRTISLRLLFATIAQCIIGNSASWSRRWVNL